MIFIRGCLEYLGADAIDPFVHFFGTFGPHLSKILDSLSPTLLYSSMTLGGG